MPGVFLSAAQAVERSNTVGTRDDAGVDSDMLKSAPVRLSDSGSGLFHMVYSPSLSHESV